MKKVFRAIGHVLVIVSGSGLTIVHALDDNLFKVLFPAFCVGGAIGTAIVYYTRPKSNE